MSDGYLSQLLLSDRLDNLSIWSFLFNPSNHLCYVMLPPIYLHVSGNEVPRNECGILHVISPEWQIGTMISIHVILLLIKCSQKLHWLSCNHIKLYTLIFAVQDHASWWIADLSWVSDIQPTKPELACRSHYSSPQLPLRCTEASALTCLSASAYRGWERAKVRIRVGGTEEAHVLLDTHSFFTERRSMLGQFYREKS